jgi:hypothetical protein
MVGEFVDSLKAFGAEGHPSINSQRPELFTFKQNDDGSWGDLIFENTNGRYHSTWTTVDGLRLARREALFSEIATCAKTIRIKQRLNPRSPLKGFAQKVLGRQYSTASEATGCYIRS